MILKMLEKTDIHTYSEDLLNSAPDDSSTTVLYSTHSISLIPIS